MDQRDDAATGTKSKMRSKLRFEVRCGREA